MSHERWRSLINRVHVVGAKRSVCDAAGIARLESAFGLTLPVGYREFCDVFGSGELSGFIRIFCLCLDEDSVDNANFLRTTQECLGLDALETELKWEIEHSERGHPAADRAQLLLFKEVLINAFCFGNDPNANIYLWDLKSYSESDQSCDIYLVPSDDLGKTTLLGRDFFEFIQDFCLGSQASKILPPNFSFFEEFVLNTFHRFDEETIRIFLPE